jgi:cytochrome c553
MKDITMNTILKTMMIAGFLVAATSVRAADAKETFDKKCAACHGKDGKGETKMGQKLGIKDFTDAKIQAAFKDEDAFKAIKEGLRDKDGKLQMKAAEGVSDDEIKALVAYVRSLKK